MLDLTNVQRDENGRARVEIRDDGEGVLLIEQPDAIGNYIVQLDRLTYWNVCHEKYLTPILFVDGKPVAAVEGREP